VQLNLAAEFQGTAAGEEARAIVGKCVHCGFCTATCPTFQVLGDERDSPRGRIYLIKQVLEGAEVTDQTRLHLDRCLTCRNCETTCPSGVQYGHLIDIGRQVVEAKTTRPFKERATRYALKEGIPSSLFKPAMNMGRKFKGLVPEKLQAKMPDPRPAGTLPSRTHARKALLLNGCAQPVMLPSIDAATARVLDALGVQAVIAPKSGCCGAVRFHMNDQDGGRNDMRRNIDAWWPMVEKGEVEAIVMNASGCGATVREYDHHLKDDPAYAEKARAITALVKDIGEYLAPQIDALKPLLKGAASAKAVFHPPCTLQHWQKLRPITEELLAQCGVELQAFGESHLCCGSAGAYSMLQPEIATQLRDRKLGHLEAAEPEVILSANIGCLTHLQSGTQRPVLHWIEWVDRQLAGV
jgi:glycolate oxidase iron-sulfur subunit